MTEEVIPEDECEETGFTCPVMECERTQDEKPELTHMIVTKTGEVFLANRSLEMEEVLSNGELTEIVAIDAIDFPEEGDRSIITIDKVNIDYTQQVYDKEDWLTLMRSTFCTKCEAAIKHHSGIGDIYQ